jgi:hypothetical protein
VVGQPLNIHIMKPKGAKAGLPVLYSSMVAAGYLEIRLSNSQKTGKGFGREQWCCGGFA